MKYFLKTYILLIFFFTSWGLAQEGSNSYLSQNSQIEKSLDQSKNFYNKGVSFLQSNQKTKAIASFRSAIYLDPWNWESQKALRQLGAPLSFWWMIPYEFFFVIIAFGLFSFLFSFKIWKSVILFLSLMLTSAFWYYRTLPRLTVLQDTPVLSAPLKDSPVIFILKSSSFVIQKGEHNTKWIQIKSEEGSGWLEKSFLWIK